jgi:hypothetical protein
MGIRVQWDNDDKTIVRWDFDGPWKWDDYFVAQLESNRLLDSVDHLVDIIGNIQKSRLLPPSAVSVYRSSLKSAAPNLGLIVLVGSSSFVRQMVNIFMKLFRFKGPGTDFRFADSEEEARQIIAEYRTHSSINK